MCSTLSAADVPELQKVLASIEQVAEYDERLNAGKSGVDFQEFEKLVQYFSDATRNLPVGERLCYPGGWTNTNPARNHAVVFILERTSDDKFGFVICNTGGGVEYHPVTNKDYPKEKRQCAMRIGDVPAEKVCDEALWYMILKLQLFAAEENSRATWYEAVVPHLTGGDPMAVIKQWEHTGGHYETPQRSGTCFYRCTLTAFRYLMKAHGFNVAQQKELFFQIRMSFLRAAEREMKECGPGVMNSSDCRLVRLAINLTGLAATKLEDRSAIDSTSLKSVAGYLDSLHQLVNSVAPTDEVGGPEKVSSPCLTAFEEVLLCSHSSWTAPQSSLGSTSWTLRLQGRIQLGLWVKTPTQLLTYS